MISGAVRDELIARHDEPHRRYHTMAHIEDCLVQLETSIDLASTDRELLEAAIWFHDAIYDPQRNDNEARSADLAVERLTAEGHRTDFVAEVARLIRLTAGHWVAEGDGLGARLVSIDLSILGAEPDRYDAYARAIREEYAHVSEPLYRAGRAAILTRFLEAPVLLPDPAWAARLDMPARANLRREIANLSA
jgi:predicted metal-dependent HD superfamily phosphohydrolase